MVTGRKPIPRELRLVKGDAGKRGGKKPPPAQDKAPPASVPPARPAPPAHLTADGKAEWKRIVGGLSDVGLMTKLDVAVLGAYCDAWSDWIEARGVLVGLASGQNLAPAILTERGRQARRALREARVDMLRFAVEFGMTPSARTRIDLGIGNPITPAGDEGEGSKAGAEAAEPQSKASRYFP